MFVVTLYIEILYIILYSALGLNLKLLDEQLPTIDTTDIESYHL